jgi:hypothetical protein
MAAHGLVILFDIVELSDLVADFICELYEGTSARVSHPRQETAAACEPPRPGGVPTNMAMEVRRLAVPLAHGENSSGQSD